MTSCDVPFSLSLCMRVLPTFFLSEPRAHMLLCESRSHPSSRNCTGRAPVSKFIYSATPIDAARFPRTMLMPEHSNSSVRNCLPLSQLSTSRPKIAAKDIPARESSILFARFRPSRSRFSFNYIRTRVHIYKYIRTYIFLITFFPQMCLLPRRITLFWPRCKERDHKGNWFDTGWQQLENRTPAVLLLFLNTFLVAGISAGFMRRAAIFRGYRFK